MKIVKNDRIRLMEEMMEIKQINKNMSMEIKSHPYSHELYFVFMVIFILAVGSFTVVETMNTMTDISLLESSLYTVIRSSDARLSAEISYGIEEANIDILENELQNIDLEINTL